MGEGKEQLNQPVCHFQAMQIFLAKTLFPL